MAFSRAFTGATSQLLETSRLCRHGWVEGIRGEYNSYHNHVPSLNQGQGYQNETV